MDIRRLLDTSKAAGLSGLLRIIKEKYIYIDRCLNSYYENSRVYYLSNRFFSGTSAFFQHSFLAEFTQVSAQENENMLINSKIGYLVEQIRSRIASVLNHNDTSGIIILMRRIGKTISATPVKTGSIIMVLAIIMNIVITLLLKKEIDSFGWLMRAIFLFLGINGLFSNVDWPTIKNNSLILRLIIGERK